MEKMYGTRQIDVASITSVIRDEVQQPAIEAIMWVTFFIDETSEEIIFSKYQVQDEAAVDLPRELSSEELVNLVVEKAAVDTTELRRKGAVKVNLRVATFNDLVLEPARRKHSGSRSSTEEVAALFTNAELILNYYGNSRRAAILHGAFCLSRAYIAGGRALLGNYAREVLPAVARPQAETIALNVEAAFLKRLSAWAEYDSDVSVMRYGTSEMVRMRSWNSTTLSFSMFAPDPEDNATDIIVGQMSDSFLQNWRNAWRSRITHRGLDVKIAITAIETLSFSADIGSRKDFILLPYVFSFPYYDVNAMPSINYGGFGAKVAFAVGQRFHGTYLSKGAGGASFSAFLSCISNASLAARLKDAPTLFAEVVSLGAVVDTYRNSNDRQRLVHMESLTGDQLLFVAMCYARCVGIHYAVHDSACDAVLQNVPEFSEAFSCARGSPMNPHQQCKLL
ncbi:hypothetical protein HPB51_028379 [Rhipicephalus microplus]|uniref:Peptidase M13 C-terminal domain-containing protein n=1 Tax=Rhipicephalus microplus TaxID=6941 RepID=A0A9J6CXF6_RHIMP|nr:hypothetical protein HPB51_028379 [Rhipicephalus microplus]